MNNKDILKIIMGILIIPVLTQMVINLICIIINKFKRLYQSHKIKKGIKNGTIIEHEGEYYEVKIES